MAQFIAPDAEVMALADPNEKFKIPLGSGHRAIDHVAELKGRNPVFDELCQTISGLTITYEDQCTARYYLDLVTTLGNLKGKFDRVVEVGVFMGGSSAIFAGLMDRFEFDLDLIDTNVVYLRYAYERIRRLFPDAAPRVRLFHGNLPSYVKHIRATETPKRFVVHHDAAHDFTQVTKDLASLSFLQQELIAIIVQDTNLRGTNYMNFVDLAIYAVFGADFSYAPIGVTYVPGHPLTSPDRFHGNYFMPNAPEGMVLPMSANRFVYPHPSLALDFFL